MYGRAKETNVDDRGTRAVKGLGRGMSGSD